MEYLRILTFDEYKNFYYDEKAKRYLHKPAPQTGIGTYNLWWLNRSVPTVATRNGAMSCADKDYTIYVKPVLVEPNADFKVGEKFTFGKDAYNIPLRWVAIDQHILISAEHEGITNSSPVKYKEIGKVLVKFATQTFSPQEQKDILSGNFLKDLVPFSGTLTISADVRIIPEGRFNLDNDITKITFSDRKDPIKIETNAFAESSLSSIENLTNCEEIGTRSFYATKIKSLSLGNIGRICQAAFTFTGLQSLQFKGIVEDIEDYSFDNNIIEQITFDENAYIFNLGKAFTENEITYPTQKKVIKHVIIQYDIDAFDKQRYKSKYKSRKL